MSSQHASPPHRSRTAIGVVLAILVIDLFVAAGAWRSMRNARRELYEDAGRTAQNLARVLAENLEGTIRLVDLALREARADLERRQRVHAPYDPTVEAGLSRLLADIPILDGIRIAGPDGRVEHGARPSQGAPVSVADRDYFAEAAAGPTAELIISSPVVSRITGKRSIALARRIDLAGGAFGGIVYAVLPLDQFARSLASVDTGRGGAVVLRGADNAIVARFPEREDRRDIVGQKQITPRLSAILASGQSEGTFVAQSPIDDDEKVNAFRRVSGGPFYLLVASSSDAFLSGWRTEVARITIAVAVFVLLSAIAAALLLRSWRRETESRFRALVEGAPLAVTLTRGPRIVYVNPEMVRVLGLRDGRQALGRSIVDSMGPEDAARASERIARRLHGLPVEPTIEVTLRRPDGSAFRAAVTDAAVELPDGQTVVGFIQDVTVQRRAEEERERLIADLRQALAQVKTLSGLLPICAHCKKIRDDRGYWNRIETFIRERSGAEFTHGICPECAAQYYPDVGADDPAHGDAEEKTG